MDGVQPMCVPDASIDQLIKASDTNNQPIYVVDTNILVDYPDIIPGEGSSNPEKPTIDLSGGHIVIPSVVVRELSGFKGEKTERGKAARVVLRRLRELVEDDVPLFKDSYYLKTPIIIPGTNQSLSIFPISSMFKRTLHFQPSEEDMDGQIILAALAIISILNGDYLEELEQQWADFKNWMKLRRDPTIRTPQLPGNQNPTDIATVPANDIANQSLIDRVTILTNDNGLAIRAHERGVRTSRYGYKYPEPYTGRRDLKVPKELFSMFYNGRIVSRTDFERLMPNERKLVANEFIIMLPENPADFPAFTPENDPYYSNVGRYDALQDAIVPLKHFRHFTVEPKSVGQALYMEALADPDIAAVICTGPAGSGKTFIVTNFGYDACLEGRFISVVVVPCENRSDIGALPGDLMNKMDPQVQPLKNALRNYLLVNDKSFKREMINLQKYGDQSPGLENGVNEHCNDDSANREPGENKGQKGRGNRRRSKDKEQKRRDKPKSERKSVKQLVDDRVNEIWRKCFTVVPIEHARGQDFAYQLAIFDEFQDQSVSQALTLITRIGAEGKIVLTGDIGQVHAPYLDRTNNGLVYASRVLYDDPMVAQVHFTEEDVVRHPLVKLIAERQERAKTQKEDI